MSDSDKIPLSALLHYKFCPRRFALIHVERLWAENRLTAEGRILHEKTDVPAEDVFAGMKVIRAMPLASEALGIYGVADTVEIFPDGTPFPVEYKHGKPNPHGSDEIQLCAQVLCLEEMTGKPVSGGALFYGKTRRRKNVEISENLRTETLRLISEARALRERGETPRAAYAPEKCNNCSLRELCLPECGSESEKLERTWQKRLAAD